MARGKQHNSDVIIVMLLFFIYAGCAIILCALGASSYRHTVAVLQEGYSERSGVLYIAQKVHQHDIGGSMRIDTHEGIDALVLVEQDTGMGFETWIFIEDGYLSEQLVASGSPIITDQAQRIAPMKTLSLSMSDRQLLEITLVTQDDDIQSISLAMRSRGGTFNTGDNAPQSPSLFANNEAMGGAPVMNQPASTLSNTGGAS